MIRPAPRALVWTTLATVAFMAMAVASPAAAQSGASRSGLSLADAIARARLHHPDAAAAAAAEQEADARVRERRAGYLPRVDITESWQRGNQPVFVFGSLLAQRRFTAADFALDALNHPGAIDNFRTGLTFDQPLFDRATSAGVAGARAAQAVAGAMRLMVDLDLSRRVTDAYGRVLIAAAAARAARTSLDAADADRELAANRRDAGRATDADVLQMDLLIAHARQQEIRARADERVARAQLNELIGEPLSAVVELADVTGDEPPTAPVAAVGAAAGGPPEVTNLAALEREALADRPEVRLAADQVRLAEAELSGARAGFFPRAGVQAGWEINGGTWQTRSASWIVGASVRMPLFQGQADRARVAAAEAQIARRTAERRRAEDQVRLDVHLAVAGVESARAEELAGRAGLAQARESLRIIRDRYGAGLTDITALLRATEALSLAESQDAAARVAVLSATAALDRALGRR